MDDRFFGWRPLHQHRRLYVRSETSALPAGSVSLSSRAAAHAPLPGLRVRLCPACADLSNAADLGGPHRHLPDNRSGEEHQLGLWPEQQTPARCAAVALSWPRNGNHSDLRVFTNASAAGSLLLSLGERLTGKRDHSPLRQISPSGRSSKLIALRRASMCGAGPLRRVPICHPSTLILQFLPIRLVTFQELAMLQILKPRRFRRRDFIEPNRRHKAER